MSEEKKQEIKPEELSKDDLDKVAGGITQVDGVNTLQLDLDSHLAAASGPTTLQ